jgi:hypothetical protein
MSTLTAGSAGSHAHADKARTETGRRQVPIAIYTADMFGTRNVTPDRQEIGSIKPGLPSLPPTGDQEPSAGTPIPRRRSRLAPCRA